MFVRICAAVVAVAALTSCTSAAPAPPGAFEALGGKVDDGTAGLPVKVLVSNVQRGIRECVRPAGEMVPDVPFVKPEGVDEPYGATKEAASAQLNDLAPIFAQSLIKD